MHTECKQGRRMPRRVGQATWRRCWMGLARAPPARDPKVGRSSEAGRAMMWQGNVHTLWSSRARLPQALGGERTNMLRSSVSSEPGNGVCVHASVMAGWMDTTWIYPPAKSNEGCLSLARRRQAAPQCVTHARRYWTASWRQTHARPLCQRCCFKWGVCEADKFYRHARSA